MAETPRLPSFAAGPSRRRRPAARDLARGLLAAAAAAALGGCTIVRVSDGSAVRTTYYPGLAVVRVAPGGAMQILDVEAVGPAIVGGQISLGWLDSQTALVPPGRCHLILWRAGETAAAELRSLVGPQTELCTPEGEGR